MALNQEVISAVCVLINKYKDAKGIKGNEVLEDEQIVEIVEGVKSAIYKHEGIYKKQS